MYFTVMRKIKTNESLCPLFLNILNPKYIKCIYVVIFNILVKFKNYIMN